jgi:hypothetical protein
VFVPARGGMQAKKNDQCDAMNGKCMRLWELQVAFDSRYSNNVGLTDARSRDIDSPIIEMTFRVP